MEDHEILSDRGQEEENENTAPIAPKSPENEEQDSKSPSSNMTFNCVIRPPSTIEANTIQANSAVSVPVTPRAIDPATHLQQARVKASPIIEIAKQIGRFNSKNPMKKCQSKKLTVQKLEMIKHMNVRNHAKAERERRSKMLAEANIVKEELEAAKLRIADIEMGENDEEENDEEEHDEEENDEGEINDDFYIQAIREELDKKLMKEIAEKLGLKVHGNPEHFSKKRKLDDQAELSKAPRKNEPASNPPTPSPTLTTVSAPEKSWIDTAPLLSELNGHLAKCRMRMTADEIMDVRSWIDKGFDAGMRTLLQHRYIDDVEAFWEDKYQEEGLNDNLKSIVKEYDTIEKLHTLRVHFDRILGEEMIFVYKCDRFIEEE
ncbi:hypothetical protein EYC80_006957 [Monilinia laxa]|uniref:Uncharacterized protein n=1 Tax=Monilinia laxa TaxID=61186 RepID=A0A5N6JZQ9_MONLA|nr:hypothetical protein EYC80_006957 [Monilinia laxa]